MPAPICVLIPTLNVSAHLPDCLSALVEGLSAGLIHELIVSDGGSEDATQAICEEAGARIVTGPPSRGGQLRRGAAVARGDWLLVIHADSVLDPGWSDAVADHLGQGGTACFRLRFRARGLMPRWVAGWANLRTRTLGLPYGDQGLLVSRRDYDAAGGYPDQPLMEDVALVRALPGRVDLLPVAITTDAGRYERDGWLRRGARNLAILTRYLLGADPERLDRAYRR